MSLAGARVIGVLLALLVPTLLVAGADAPVAASLAVLVLSAGVVRLLGRHGVMTAATVASMRPVDSRTSAPFLACRVTDPVRSPLRPRAPGLA